MYIFEAKSLIMFRQIELFNNLVLYRRIRQRDLRNKYKLTREFDTGEVVVVTQQVKSSRKYGVSPKLLFKTKRSCIVLVKDTPIPYLLQ